MNIQINTSNSEQILEHLTKCDLLFVPALSERTDLQEYSIRLEMRATRIEIFEKTKLVGLVAAYFNQGEDVFITNVSVLPNFQGKGVGRKLMQRLFAECNSRHLKSIVLRVGKENRPAISLYRGLGFEVNSREVNLGEEIEMQKDLI